MFAFNGSHLMPTGTFSATLTTEAFDPSRLRWFATCSCKPVARGQFVLVIYFSHLLRRLLRHTDIPRPNFIWPHREQLRLGVDGMNSLATTLTGLIAGRQQPIHRTYRAVITAFIEQDSEDGGRGDISEALTIEQAQQQILLGRCQR
jgi:hypothetical protein